jgi:hypothetical protein
MAVRGVLVAQGPQVKPAGDATSVPVVVVVVNAPTTLVPSPPTRPFVHSPVVFLAAVCFLGLYDLLTAGLGWWSQLFPEQSNERTGGQTKGRSQARTRRREMEARNSLS